MLSCRKRKPTTSKHSVEATTPVVPDVELVEHRPLKKSKTDGAEAVVQKDKAPAPQDPLVAEESQKLAKLSYGDDAKKTPVQVVSWNRKLEDVEWDVGLSELQEYKEERGDCSVPVKYPANPQLARWVKTQRRQYKLLKNGHHSCMTEDRIKKLEAMDGWFWIIFECGNFDGRLTQLQKYKQEHGDCMVPYICPTNPQLGAWVRTQREGYRLLKGGKMSFMTQDHIYSLEKLGFVWLLPKIQAQEDKAIPLAAKKKLEERHATSDSISCAIAASNPEAAASTALAAAANIGQEITNFAAVDLTKIAPVEGIAGDEEEIFAYILRCVITNKTPGIL